MEENLLKKRQKLRNNEYYNTQNLYDDLYRRSKNNKKFSQLVKYISDKENILLAYRNIKRNSGSKTVGTDNLDISFFEKMDCNYFIKRIQNKFKNYQPKSVRRVEIPKHKGSVETRPLGIPCIEDRIIQQCIKQILEPICEAKFHNHSYGFRPNRSTNHAIARCNYLMWKCNLHYVVDIDIKGFFDNVNHAKLKKQMWNLGIQDKNLLAIVGKILKSEIQGVGIPNKGTPQGGIISPLLSNIVLNELDWWISSQWETFESNHSYANTTNKFVALRNGSKLKSMFIVRYADDFKIFCKDYKTAQKIYNATRLWLKQRLNLDISPEKSKITNLRRNYTEFLGFKLKVKAKGGKYVSTSKMSEKAIKSTINKLKKQIKKIQRNIVDDQVIKLNSMILGCHNYYRTATNISADFAKIDFLVTRTLDIRLRSSITNKPKFSKAYENIYGEYKGKIRTICKTTIFPIYGCKNTSPMNFNQGICNYTVEGRKFIHDKLSGYHRFLIQYILRNADRRNSAEYNDNRISLMAGQKGKCYVTNEYLEADNMECHHKKPKCFGGTDEYKNLVWICGEAHRLIHAKNQGIIVKYLKELNLDEKGLKRVNSLRKLVENSVI